MDLGNPIKIIVNHLQIRRMTCLGCRDGFPMVSAHWIGPTVNHNARISIVMIHQVITLHELSTLKGY